MLAVVGEELRSPKGPSLAIFDWAAAWLIHVAMNVAWVFDVRLHRVWPFLGVLFGIGSFAVWPFAAAGVSLSWEEVNRPVF